MYHVSCNKWNGRMKILGIEKSCEHRKLEALCSICILNSDLTVSLTICIRSHMILLLVSYFYNSEDNRKATGTCLLEWPTTHSWEAGGD
ncbi:hypothetical protein SLE2022_058940 [Rubroshorea leprosula]